MEPVRKDLVDEIGATSAEAKKADSASWTVLRRPKPPLFMGGLDWSQDGSSRSRWMSQIELNIERRVSSEDPEDNHP